MHLGETNDGNIQPHYLEPSHSKKKLPGFSDQSRSGHEQADAKAAKRGRCLVTDTPIYKNRDWLSPSWSHTSITALYNRSYPRICKLEWLMFSREVSLVHAYYRYDPALTMAMVADGYVSVVWPVDALKNVSLTRIAIIGARNAFNLTRYASLVFFFAFDQAGAHSATTDHEQTRQALLWAGHELCQPYRVRSIPITIHDPSDWCLGAG